MIRFDLAARVSPYELTPSGWMTPAEIAQNEEHQQDVERDRRDAWAPVERKR